MKPVKQAILFAAALLLSACVVAPESGPETTPESVDPPPDSAPSSVEGSTLSEPAPDAGCPCHVPGINGQLRCIASCPAGTVCSPSHVCQKP